PSLGLHWNQMSAAQRTTNAISCGDLVWDGPLTTARAPIFLGPKPLLHVNSPAPAAGDYQVGEASFGPPLGTTGLTGDVVLANDGTGVVTNACEPILNVVAGKIVLMDRGGCAFTVKVKNAQNAGAIGVVVADSVAGCPPAGMGGADATITIPSVRVTLTDGTLLKANLVGQNSTMSADVSKRAGTGVGGRVMMFSPNPFQSGSSVSHWDTSPTPDLLMEPAINTSLSTDPDLTIQAFGDLGWFGATGVAVTPGGGVIQLALSQNAPNPGSGYLRVDYAIPLTGRVQIRVFDVNGRLVATPLDATMDAGPHTAQIQTAGLAAGVYFYRLEAAGKSLSRRLVILD
ncbi:MAG: PA domain-containing protein, partial [Candidatus Eiseniibacteriota bacterium]